MKWYVWLIISLVIAVAVLVYLLQRNAQLLKSCNEIAHLQYVTYHNEVIEYNEKIGHLDSVVARHSHERDSVAQYAAITQGALKTQTRALRTRYRPDTLRLTTVDTLVITQDSLIESLETERATVKVKTDELINSIEAKARLSEDEVSKWIGRFQESEARRMADEKEDRRHRRKERVLFILAIGGALLL